MATSAKAAACMMARVGSTLRADILRTIQTAPGMTAKECAAALNQNIKAVRPRITELAQSKLITRDPDSSRRNTIWHGARP